jgi:hypothetical protein
MRQYKIGDKYKHYSFALPAEFLDLLKLAEAPLLLIRILIFSDLTGNPSFNEIGSNR